MNPEFGGPQLQIGNISYTGETNIDASAKLEGSGYGFFSKYNSPTCSLRSISPQDFDTAASNYHSSEATVIVDQRTDARSLLLKRKNLLI